jgi:hypothetical protein
VKTTTNKALHLLHLALVDIRCQALAIDNQRIALLADSLELIPNWIIQDELSGDAIKALMKQYDDRYGHKLRRYGDLLA